MKKVYSLENLNAHESGDDIKYWMAQQLEFKASSMKIVHKFLRRRKGRASAAAATPPQIHQTLIELLSMTTRASRRARLLLA